jgi:hypothetical protein
MEFLADSVPKAYGRLIAIFVLLLIAAIPVKSTESVSKTAPVRAVVDEVQSRYLDMPILMKSKIVSVVLSAVWKNTDISRMYFYKFAHESNPIICTVKGEGNIPASLDCPLEPIRIVPGYDSFLTYEFVVKSEQTNWIEIYTNHRLDQTVWLKRNPNFPLVTLSSWVVSDAGIAAADSSQKELTILDTPTIGAKPLGSCSSAHFDVDRRNSLGVFFDGNIRGDYLQVHCDTAKCFSEHSQTVCAGEEKEDLEVLRQNPACMSGWVKWRDGDRLLVIPSSRSTGNGC